MNDSKLFSKKKIRVFNGRRWKTKYLLKKKYQERVLREVKKIGREIKRKNGVKKVYLGGSVVKKQLGKYARKWMERYYSDIDFYIIVTNPNKLKRYGLVKKLHGAKRFGKVDKFFRVSIMGRDGEPMKVLDRFSVDVWLCSSKSFQKDLKRFPDLLDNAIEV